MDTSHGSKSSFVFYFVIDLTIKESSVEIDDEIWFTRVY